MTPRYLILKDQTVHWIVCDALIEAESAVAAFFASLGLQGTVTAAKDGQHSVNTRHFPDLNDPRPAQAIDLRTREIPAANQKAFCMRLVAHLNSKYPCDGSWVGVLHVSTSPGPHLHLEWNPAGTPPNVVNYKADQTVYESLT